MTTIIVHDFAGVSIGQRQIDGFINGTAMCVAQGKELKEWFRNKETFELFSALEDSLGIKSNRGIPPISSTKRLSASEYVEIFPKLITVKKGSPDNGGGTWLHPDLAIQLAQWCSPLFAIQVSRWIREWMTTGQNPVQSKADVERLAYRTTLKDEARLRATDQVKVYLTQINKYEDKVFTGKMFTKFHDAINVAITGEQAWVMKLRLADIIGRKIGDQELIRDYFPAMPLQRYIAISEAAANLMIQQNLSPIKAVEQAARLVLPAGYTPSPINFVEHIKTFRMQMISSKSG